MVRRRREGAHELSSAHSRISANPTSIGGLAAVANAQAHRSWSGGWGVSGSEVGLAPRIISAAARPRKVALPIAGPGWNRRARLSKRSCWEWIEQEMVEGGAQRRLLYSSKAAAGPCTRVARLGGRQT